jgi:hypothetical protein
MGRVEGFDAASSAVSRAGASAKVKVDGVGGFMDIGLSRAGACK